MKDDRSKMASRRAAVIFLFLSMILSSSMGTSCAPQHHATSRIHPHTHTAHRHEHPVVFGDEVGDEVAIECMATGFALAQRSAPSGLCDKSSIYLPPARCDPCPPHSCCGHARLALHAQGRGRPDLSRNNEMHAAKLRFWEVPPKFRPTAPPTIPPLSCSIQRLVHAPGFLPPLQFHGRR